ncbi:DNA polymerase IV [Mergibacter septicus]|uniref:DNA polymerase IV n=1 Tax=Mergibacter septicus TaxID=221402 RepID=UPI001C788443|nr:DNA polymerase IV [Mergibacter septicus]QDJ12741.1 DNA polymerase IV [Mergibacter septicus]
MQKIIHIDMDCFYAAIEICNNPALRGKPVAVGGDPHRRGVLTTCNYEARHFGLHSAMPSAQAVRRCPNLILLPVNMPLYRQVSAEIHQIFQRYTQLIEPLSLDEAYLDVTECRACNGSATWIANEIRQAIATELHLTASAGIAPLKFLAKIASEQNKPNGQFVIPPEQVDAFIATLPLKKIPGVGKVSAEKLAQLGLHTCGDIRQFSQHRLFDLFGKAGQRIWQFSHGIDERKVQPQRIRKSVGIEITLEQDIELLEQGIEIAFQLYPKLLQRLRQTKCQLSALAVKLSVKLKFDDFQTTTIEKIFQRLTEDNAPVFDDFQQLLTTIWQRRQHRKIRLIGLQINLPDPNILPANQLSLW